VVDETEMNNKSMIRALRSGGGIDRLSLKALPSGPIKCAGTSAILLGLFAAIIDQDEIGNYLVAAGLMFHLTDWFDSWWRQA
jgi:hypothetical protein